MGPSENIKNYLLLHLIVFFWGFTAILGKLITVPTMSLIWFRVIIALVAIFLYIRFKGHSLNVSFRAFLQFMGVGFLIALHWYLFYEAVEVSNVSVTLACFSSGALFASFLEPLFYKRKMIWYEFFFGLIVIAGLYLIFRVETKYALGISYVVMAAFLSALFAVLNSKLVKEHDSKTICFYELIGVLLTVFVFFVATGKADASLFTLPLPDLGYLLVFGLVCTAFTFIKSVEVMKKISPYTVVLSLNMEPVYGIILAFFIFGEDEKMTAGFYIGTLVILGTLFANAALKRFTNKK